MSGHTVWGTPQGPLMPQMHNTPLHFLGTVSGDFTACGARAPASAMRRRPYQQVCTERTALARLRNKL